MNTDERLDRVAQLLESLTRRVDGLTETAELIQAAQLATEKKTAELYEADARARHLIAELTELVKGVAGLVIENKRRIDNLEGKRPQ